MRTPLFISSRQNRRSHALRSAVVDSFRRPAGWIAETLGGFTETEWRANLAWLDTSGLALYLLDRIAQLHCEASLPPAILERLRRNWADNTAKNAALLAEAVSLNQGLDAADVLFSNLKGITLTPHSVPEFSLRFQLDLDFLVCVDDRERAMRVFEARGYVISCMSADTLELKADGADDPSIDDLYKIKPQRVAEIHLAPAQGLLERIQRRSFGSVSMPSLSPTDLYVQQALHLFKHLCSSFTRAAWVLEYRRHMLSRSDDGEFWLKIEGLVLNDPQARLALGAVSMLVVEIFGDQPCGFLAGLIGTTLSAPVQLWIKRYGKSAMLADYPGTKLYLLLQAELERSKPRRAALLPLAPPPMITVGPSGEGLRSKMKRGWIQLGFWLFRLRFHSVEGVRYLLESFRFRRLVAELIP